MHRQIKQIAARTCATALLLGLAATAANADLVYGRVSGGGFNPKKDKFQVAGLTVGTNEHGDFRIVLDPGPHKVVFHNQCATISGDSGPIHQDIVFKPCPK